MLTLVRHDKKRAYPADRGTLLLYTSYSVLHLILNLIMISFRPVKFFQISTTWICRGYYFRCLVAGWGVTFNESKNVHGWPLWLEGVEVSAAAKVIETSTWNNLSADTVTQSHLLTRGNALSKCTCRRKSLRAEIFLG